jgi:ribosomal-protein-alanine N-acetyltransferase
LVVDTLSGQLAGVINLNEVVRGPYQSAYLGYYAFRPFEGRGFMRAGLALAITRTFRELKLHRVEANIQPANTRSIALVKRLGFRLEGLSPRYLKVGGQWQDHQRWALLADEWRSRSGAA